MKTTKGKLKHGLKIGDKLHKDFEMREATAGDMFEAEKDAGVETPLAFSGAMMAYQLDKVGDFEGPITFAMIGKLSPADYNILREAQLGLESEGKPE